jgi:dipeptidyl aminopeptidase/acylaminoacyl peptidase
MNRAALVWIGWLTILATAPVEAQSTESGSRRPMKVDDLFGFQRVSDPQISPDGSAVVYVVTAVDLPGNKTSSTLWLANGKDRPRQLTTAKQKDRHPRWSPNGKHILFESNRSGSMQLWVIDVAGGEARQLTTIATEAATGLWSPDGTHIAFVSAVWPEYSAKPFNESDELNKKRMDDMAKSPVKAKVFTRLFFRHWDEYVEDKRQHLFVIPFTPARSVSEDPVSLREGPSSPRDVTPGDRDANPTSDTFSAGDDFTFSPDGTHLVFTAVPAKHEAWSTNYDICRVPVASGKIECLTASNPAADGAPRFSPDGKHLAYRAQRRPGFEADKWELMVVPCTAAGTFQGQPKSLTADLDQSIDSLTWFNSETLLFTAEKATRAPIYALDLKDGKPRTLEANGYNTAVSVSFQSGGVAFSQAAMDRPPEVFRADGHDILLPYVEGKAARNISQANSKLLAELDMPRPESVTVPGAGGTPMQMWILKPPGFDANKKWPLAFLVHGGPQGAWEDGWSYRWNPEAWAAQGYVVALPNPRGSTGFGQKYVDEISHDWGGKCFDDLMAGLAYLEKQPYIDTTRMAAAGASFGGYMMNWLQGHTTKFKTLITHCGVYNFDSMYGLTEELWFDEWEHGGLPWQNRASYEKFSPHRFAKDFKTPMLIIHNDLDFRVPVAEGLQLFTTLQRLGVPSRMINFPDEGHWVLKPANSQYWHKEVFAWLAKYAPPGGK